MKILNLGSLNIDKVYNVPHFVCPGETISSTKYNEFPGGKGLNQSIALSYAGAAVFHGGKIGSDGHFLKEVLQNANVNTDYIIETSGTTGHAVIQLDEKGENCILLFGGTNRQLASIEIDSILAEFEKGDMLVLQNEINSIDYIIDKAYEKEMSIALNPSPLDDSMKSIDYSKIDYLILNEVEGEQLTGETDPHRIIDELLKISNELKIVLTLGSRGSIYADNKNTYTQNIYKAKVVDTTAAGDTFTGYFLSLAASGKDIPYALKAASRAAALAVETKGASTSIPRLENVLNSL